ncbi:sulfotransferase 2B1-like isoform X2 [Sardina pilchardus]|uniref:sulfotransferase 2B1-like isoform X2 n=1 Tax=Sardina pilchardus TaxID=27697 RepID=UPI002E144AF1
MTEAELYSVYKGVYVPKLLHPPECLKYYEEFNFREDDILIAAYPKSGTTWMKEIVPLIQSEGDLTPVQTIPNWDRVPWLEENRASILNLEERPSPRIFATHFHYNMMPESFFKVKPKVLCVLRNPKDVFVSSFYYYVMFGSWFDHVKGWIHAKHQENILYIFYEEMIMDLKESVRKLSSFLGKSLGEELIEKISDHCVFKNMKQNQMSNYSLVPAEFLDQNKSEFLRKGISGDWRNTLTTAQSDHFDSVYEEKMKDVKFPFLWA